MTLMTRDDYIESLRRIKKRVFIMGQEVENLVDHPLVRPSLNACAMTYELARQPEHADPMLATSNLTGRTVNRFTHLHQSTADMVAKVKMLRLLGRMTGCCFQRCVGMDAFNAVDSVTYEMDRAAGTKYHPRFRRYLQHVQEHDLVVDGAMTDPKGDRRLRPSQQADPDLFAHIVERRSDGIVVRGAKLHQTGALNSHEILVMPTQTLSEEDRVIESLAVLPLANLSGDPQQEYFVDGMTEELISALAKVSALRVTSRTTAMRYKGSTKSLPEIAKELGVDAIVEGSVTRSGSQVKITAQLIDAAKDRHLWADSFQRDLKDVLALQGEVAKAIAGEVGVRLTPEERLRLTEKKTVNPEAYEAYLKGNHHLFRRTATDAQKSLEYFQQAVEKQPDYALAYAGIAEAYETAAGSAQGALPPMEAFPKAKAAAMRAVELDATLGEPHVSLAWSSFVFDRDWTTAENQFQRAIRLSPNYPTAHENYATFLSRMGRFDESLREARRAQELDPLSLSGNTMMGIHLGLARRDEEAIPWFRRVLAMDPSFLRAHFGLGLALVHRKRYDEAITELQKAVELSGGGAAQLGALGYAYAVANRRAEALEIAERLKQRSREHYVPPAMVATVFSGLGDKDQAMTWLEKAIEEHDPWLTGLKVDPMFDPLRSDPRFLDLMHRVGLN